MKIKLLHPDAVVPKYAKEGDSGFDLVAVEEVTVPAGGTVMVSTGLAFDIPDGYEIQIRPRSGITSKTKLRVALGTIDSGYRGEVKVTVDNIDQVRYVSRPRMMRGIMAGDEDFNITVPVGDRILIEKGTRIAQGVLVPVAKTTFEVVHDLSETDRGTNGFGSTGVS